jgi:hypothetical protein
MNICSSYSRDVFVQPQPMAGHVYSLGWAEEEVPGLDIRLHGLLLMNHYYCPGGSLQIRTVHWNKVSCNNGII